MQELLDAVPLERVVIMNRSRGADPNALSEVQACLEQEVLPALKNSFTIKQKKQYQEKTKMVMAAVIYEMGGPEVFRWEEVEVGSPGSREVRLRHTAIGVNYADTYHRGGVSHAWDPGKLPIIVGFEAVGEVIEVGPDVTELVVERNSLVQITLNNNDDMLHNLVIVQAGPDNADIVGQMAMELGLKGADLNYVPDSDLVLFHTGIIQPETSESIYFQVPKRRGEYWILCTSPGHSFTMRAKLIVK